MKPTTKDKLDLATGAFIFEFIIMMMLLTGIDLVEYYNNSSHLIDWLVNINFSVITGLSYSVILLVRHKEK